MTSKCVTTATISVLFVTLYFFKGYLSVLTEFSWLRCTFWRHLGVKVISSGYVSK